MAGSRQEVYFYVNPKSNEKKPNVLIINTLKDSDTSLTYLTSIRKSDDNEGWSLAVIKRFIERLDKGHLLYKCDENSVTFLCLKCEGNGKFKILEVLNENSPAKLRDFMSLHPEYNFSDLLTRLGVTEMADGAGINSKTPKKIIGVRVTPRPIREQPAKVDSQSKQKEKESGIIRAVVSKQKFPDLFNGRSAVLLSNLSHPNTTAVDQSLQNNLMDITDSLESIGVCLSYQKDQDKGDFVTLDLKSYDVAFAEILNNAIQRLSLLHIRAFIPGEHAGCWKEIFPQLPVLPDAEWEFEEDVNTTGIVDFPKAYGAREHETSGHSPTIKWQDSDGFIPIQGQGTTPEALLRAPSVDKKRVTFGKIMKECSDEQQTTVAGRSSSLRRTTVLDHDMPAPVTSHFLFQCACQELPANKVGAMICMLGFALLVIATGGTSLLGAGVATAATVLGCTGATLMLTGAAVMFFNAPRRVPIKEQPEQSSSCCLGS